MTGQHTLAKWCFTLTLALAGFHFAATLAEEPAPKAEASNKPVEAAAKSELDGTWLVVAESNDGKQWKKKSRKIDVPRLYYCFANGEHTLRQCGVLESGPDLKFTLTTAASPKQIKIALLEPMEKGPISILGLYEIKDDTLTLALGQPGTKPATLEPAAGVQVTKLERVKKDKQSQEFDGVWEHVQSELDGHVYKPDPEKPDLSVFEDGICLNYRDKSAHSTKYYKLSEKNGVLCIDMMDWDYGEKHPKIITFPGIYEIKNGEMKCCFTTIPDGPRPTKFAAPKDGDTSFGLLKRKQ